MVGPVSERSEFEVFAEDVAERPLPVYGRRLFSETPTTFAPVDRVPLPADYVLGPGDQLLVHAWGKINLDTAVTVDRNGQIFLPTVGTLTVAGLRYSEAEGYLHSAIARLYKGFELNVTIGQLRSIQIFVLGNVRQPGTYTISALSTLVNALFISGGPSATGSMRHIELRRDNQVLTDFDMYDLLRKGDKSHDARLLPGDVIYIAPAGPQVAVTGSAGQPGIYELKGETTIGDVLKDAGGLSNVAGTDRVLLERIENDGRRSVDRFPLNAGGFKRRVHDGDILEIFPISPQIENAVTLQGNVAHPGHYAWREGLRVSDLIPTRDSLIPRRYWNQQNHLVAPSANFERWDGQTAPAAPGAGSLSRESSGTIPGTTSVDRNQRRLFTGADPAENQPQQTDADADWLPQQDLPKPLDVMDELAQNSAEINWDYAAIERLDRRDLTTHLIAFNLGKALDDSASPDNQTLLPGDVITIFSRRDLPLPEEKHAAFVRISGEVNAPGIYRIRPGETLRDTVKRAGGITSRAYLYAAQLTRASARLAEEEQLKLSIDQMRRDLLSRYAASSTFGANNPSQQQAQFASQQAAIVQLSAVRPTGRVVLDMTPRAGAVQDIPDFPLEDGDSFYIPARLNTVQVAGAVYNQNAFRYEPRKRLAKYLADAGGATRQGDVKHIFLIRADGTVVSRQSPGGFWHEGFDKLALLPGDAIIVPAKLRSPNGFMQQIPFVSQMISQTALTGAVVGTTY
jgi:protein involved in polysaccharide export with SLBB domain